MSTLIGNWNHDHFELMAQGVDGNVCECVEKRDAVEMGNRQARD
jgi:hypothetical protein